MDDAADKARRPSRRLLDALLLRGESEVACTGLLLAALLLLTVGTCAWWSVRAQGASLDEQRRAELNAYGAFLAETCATLIAMDELSTARRLLVDAGRALDLEAARIVLPGGAVIAHSDVSNITTAALPPRWPEGPVVVPSLAAETGAPRLERAMVIPGRGPARLDLVAGPMRTGAMLAEVAGGVGVIGAVALLLLLLVYRRLRARARAAGVIREALLAHVDDDAPLESLSVPGDLGSEARAWNRLLEEIGELRDQLVRRRVGEALASTRESSEDLGSACDIMRHGLMLVDGDLRVTYLNGAAAVYLGGSRTSIAGRPLADAVADQAVLDAARRAVDGSSRTWNAVEVERRDGETTGVLRYSVRPLRREDTSAAVVIVEDVTQQRIADEARSAFVAQVTHELRAPLTNIRLYAETAIELGSTDVKSIERSLNVINQEAKRLERVVGDMLSISEIEAGSYELARSDVRLDQLLEDVRAKHEASATEKGLELVFDLPPKLPVIGGDREKITLALDNLVGNAIKYTPSGTVTVKAAADEDRFTLEVSDSGIGIDEREHDRIFDRFYRANDTRLAEITGSGLGLALAREVIRLHGGDITVESVLDQGSTFTLVLPVSKREGAAR